MIEMRTSKLRAGVVAVLTLAISALGAAGAHAADPTPGSAHLPRSVTMTAPHEPRDYSAETLPMLLCDGPSDCLVESDGTVGSVRLDLFALKSAGASLRRLTPDIKLAVFDAHGNIVEKLANFDCNGQSWPQGNFILCTNSVADWSATIPAGGKIAPTGYSLYAVFLDARAGNAWVVGHDFSDKNTPLTTVWDNQIPVP